MSEPVRGINFRRLEEDLAQAAKETQPAPMSKMPTMAELGRIGGDAVIQQYEHAAKKVEQMGDEVRERVRRLEKALAECSHDMQLIAESALAIREKGQLVQAQIEEAATLSADIREVCAAITKKVGE